MRSALSEGLGIESSVAGSNSKVPVSPLYNLVPEYGHPAEFGFDIGQIAHIHLYPSIVHTSSGYLVRVTTPDTPMQFLSYPGQRGFLGGVTLTFFGDPAKQNGGGASPTPFFTNPTDCSAGSLTTVVHVDTWTSQGRVNADGTPDFSDPNWLEANSPWPRPTGCDMLQFDPSIAFDPSTSRAGAPAGGTLQLNVPQAPGSDAVPATPELREATVTLPAGMVLSPSAANGLQACSPAQIGLEANGPPTCPAASKIGDVEVTTPLLAKPVGGSLYLAEEGNNPFGSLLAIYLVVEDPTTGVLIKLAGQGELGNGTNGLQLGQIRTTFQSTPELPFSMLKIHLKEGPRAPLVTPRMCGSYSAVASLTPWSAPESGPPALQQSSFTIGSGPAGQPCSSLGFTPSLSAGTVSDRAGAFSPFTLTLSRSDTDEDLGGLTVQTPPGLLGMLSAVSLCQEPQATEGTCPPASLIGHVTVGAGAGPDPVFVPQAGKFQDPVYLTGPYKGAPFGLSVVVPAEAGPFNLDENGKPVVVRSAITVDPHTAQITIASDPFPSILRGVPLQIKTINVLIDREGFMFNPTNCSSLSVNGTVASTQNTRTEISTPFQVAELRKPRVQAQILCFHFLPHF